MSQASALSDLGTAPTPRAATPSPAAERAAAARADRGERREDDGGFATVWAAGAIAVVLAVMLIVVNLGVAASSRHRAEAAADLAALAAASHASDGEQTACAYAARVAEGMSTRLLTCRLSGWEARVEMEARASLPAGFAVSASGRARAGPAGE